MKNLQKMKAEKVENAEEKKICDLVYNIKRYEKHRCPFTIYLPSRGIMFKMMKACIGCDLTSDLWFSITECVATGQHDLHKYSDSDC